MAEASKVQIFAIVGTRNPGNIAKKIEELKIKSLALTDDAWLAVFDGTTREFAEKLGIRQGEIGAAGLLFPIDNYSGRASKDVWEWIALNRPADD